MNDKVLLSYSTINNYYLSPHSYYNKLMGIETPETEPMREGKKAHAIFQDHVIGIKKDERLKDFDWSFQKKEYHCRKDFSEKYQFHGYCDAVSFESKTFLELKTVTKESSVWSQGKFHAIMQPRYYSWVTGLKKCLFVSCTFDFKNIKCYSCEFDADDWHKAQEWAEEAARRIDVGDFYSDLVDGKCQGCSYKELCYFSP